MTNLTASSSLDPVPQIETNTQVLGGAGGPANMQAQALLNRTAYLSDALAAVAAAVTQPSPETFVAGTNFTPGTTTTLTLAHTYGSVNNLDVHFDSTFQGPDQIVSLVGNTLTFSSPIPIGVSNVYIKGGTTQSVGVPADASITVPKLASDVLAALGTSGSTASRPVPIKIGQPYFDTTLLQPIWASQVTPSVIWVNSAGVQV